VSASGDGSAAPARTKRPAALRTVTGRIPGRRGLATRTRLLRCTAEAIATVPYRDLSLAAIARAAGTSPATFYQYFEGLDAAILALADGMLEQGSDLAALVDEGDWEGPAAEETAARVVDRFTAFWVEQRDLIRVIELLSEEGDRRFQRVRKHTLLDFTRAVGAAIEQHSVERSRRFRPMGAAAALISMLAHVTTYQDDLPSWGIPVNDVRSYMTYVLQWTVTGHAMSSSSTSSV
jgi:AcrR family transcriptional regulator